MAGRTDSRWWEFYGVRYAQGAVIGALIVYFLFSQAPEFKELLFLPEDAKNFSMAHLTLLAIYGLAYCYLASAPILVLHAGRGLLLKSSLNRRPERGAACRTLAFVALSTLPMLLYFLTSQGRAGGMQLAALFLLCGPIALQLIVLYMLFWPRRERAIAYYREIAKRRALGTRTEYVESYRHLREHGNSFFIVVLEILLAIPIFIFVCQPGMSSEDSIRYFLLIVFVWVLPSALIWFWGNLLENQLLHMNEQ